jgi:hypothetical protein
MTDKAKDKSVDLDLEAFFAAEKELDTTPPDGLITAVLRDAKIAQPEPLITGGRTAIKAGDWLGEIIRGFGGWRGAMALATCLIIGLSLGYTPPEALWDLTSDVLDTAGISTDSEEYSPLGYMLVEG